MRKLLPRFLVTLVSSWIANPIAILLAQATGIANEREVLVMVFGIGATGHFVLFLNECLAVAQARGDMRVPGWQIAVIIAAQTSACAWALLTLTELEFPATLVLAACGLLAVNSLISYHCAGLYYRAATKSRLSAARAAVSGALPGIVSLAIYASFSLAYSFEPSLPRALLLSTAVLPSAIQWFYLRRVVGDTPPAQASLREPNFAPLIAAIVTLGLLAVALTSLRNSLAQMRAEYLALIVVGLTSLGSLANTVTRAMYLGWSAPDIRHTGTVLALVALAAGMFTAGWPRTLAWLIAAQIAVIVAVEYSRRLPTRSVSLARAQRSEQ